MFRFEMGDKTAGHLGGMVERMQVATKTGADRISQFQDEWKRVGVRLHFPPSKIKLLKKKTRAFVYLLPSWTRDGESPKKRGMALWGRGRTPNKLTYLTFHNSATRPVTMLASTPWRQKSCHHNQQHGWVLRRRLPRRGTCRHSREEIPPCGTHPSQRYTLGGRDRGSCGYRPWIRLLGAQKASST